MSEHEDSAERAERGDAQAEATPRTLLETVVWILIPIAIAVTLAISYWPR